MPHRLERAQRALLPSAGSQDTATQQLDQRAFQCVRHACSLRATACGRNMLRKSKQRRQQLWHKQRALPCKVSCCVDQNHSGRPREHRAEQSGDHL